MKKLILLSVLLVLSINSAKASESSHCLQLEQALSIAEKKLEKLEKTAYRFETKIAVYSSEGNDKKVEAYEEQHAKAQRAITSASFKFWDLSDEYDFECAE